MPNETVRANAQIMPAEGAIQSRRAALAVLAGLPALAIPKRAFAASDDAEIVALSAQIVALDRQADEIQASRVDPVDDEWNDMAPRDWEGARAFRETSGRTLAIQEMEKLFAAAGRLFERMMKIPATAPAGRAAKVRALLVHVLGSGWRGPEMDDWGYEQTRALLAEFAGMTEEEIANV